MVTTILLTIAALSFAARAIGAKTNIDLIALGLLAWALSVLIPHI